MKRVCDVTWIGRGLATDVALIVAAVVGFAASVSLAVELVAN
jgi:hypothetical protein